MFVFLSLLSINACTDKNLVVQEIKSGGNFSWNNGVGTANSMSSVTFIVENTGEFSFKYAAISDSDNGSIQVSYQDGDLLFLQHDISSFIYKKVKYGTVFKGQRITIYGYKIKVKDVRIESVIEDNNGGDDAFDDF